MKNSSKLLFNEEPIVINKLAAKVLGLNEAIVVQQIHYWLEINRKAKKNFYDGRTWTYNTYDEWQEENFDFWSTRTLKRIFTGLFDKGILLKGNYNTYKYDRTMWVSIDYNKLDEILAKYEENVEIPTKCQDVTMSDSNIMPTCHYAKGQNVTMDNDNLSLTIPETTTETSTEISITTQSEQNVPVVETNKELIESKTHLLLDSKNKKDKVAKWNKERLVKAIEIFIEQEGQYFSLLEKIYKDDKNFVPTKSTSGTKGYNQVKTRFHNITDRTKNYTPEQLEKLLKENQKAKYAKAKAEELKSQANKINEIEITEELVRECRASIEYFNSLDEITKDAIKDYVSKNCLFLPMHLRKE